jgi:hypothetical protein
MAVVWTLEIDGTTQTLAEWGLNQVRFHRLNMGIDTLTAVRVMERADEDSLCAYGATVRLYRDGVKWFEGERVVSPENVAPESESQVYVFEGPWAWMARNIFRQQWVGALNGLIQSVYTSHIILSGTVANQVSSVIAYAAARGAPLQAGTIEGPVIPPISEIIDRTCSNVIQDATQYAPDSIGWFDYSTTPPTFHLRARSNLAAITLQTPDTKAAGAPGVGAWRIVPRPDLQVPSVELTFETTSTVDGEPRHGFQRERYPLSATGFEDGCLAATINLQGFSATKVRATLEGETIDTTSLAWWQKVAPKLADPDIFNLALVEGSVNRIGEDGSASDGLAQRLVAGAAEEWMDNPDGSPVQWQREIVSARFSYQKYDTLAGEPKSYDEEYISVGLVATNAPNGETDYEALSTFEDGESAPVGLAQYLYESLNPLHYDCSFAVIEQDPSAFVAMGNTVNFTGSRAAYASMAALIQEVNVDIDRGVTSIVAGPPKHLSLSDLLALMRANRIRRRWTNPDTQSTGEIGGRDVNLGRGTADTNATHGQGFDKRLVVRDTRSGAGGGVNKLILDATSALFQIDFGGDTTLLLQGWAKPLTVQEVSVCINNDNNWRMLVIGSAPYRPGA